MAAVSPVSHYLHMNCGSLHLWGIWRIIHGGPCSSDLSKLLSAPLSSRQGSKKQVIESSVNSEMLSYKHKDLMTYHSVICHNAKSEDKKQLQKHDGLGRL